MSQHQQSFEDALISYRKQASSSMTKEFFQVIEDDVLGLLHKRGRASDREYCVIIKRLEVLRNHLFPEDTHDLVRS